MINNNYFTDEIDKYIIEFISSSCYYSRSLIYEQKIHGPLKELCTNIINRFGFYNNCGENFSFLLDECMSFLNTKLDKFNNNNGKAFSYFSIICKRYLIQKSNAYLQKTKS